MKRLRSGFTLIEISLFLAVTGLLFVAVTVGVQNSVLQQRYEDTVQSYVEFLRNIYSEVTNVQHDGTGNTERAVYGKMITFGETCDLSGSSVIGGACRRENLSGDINTIYEYNVVGDAKETSTGDTLGLLRGLNATVLEKKADDKYALAGIAESYTPKWQAQIEPTNGRGPFTGTILIVRNPRSGAVSTYYSPNVIHVNATKDSGKSLDLNGFSNTSNIDFCINQVPEATSGFRRDVRIRAGARNASDVIIENDDESRKTCGA